MMPLGPEDLRGIFTMVKAFRTKFPAHAEGLVARVGKMLRATPEEMEAGLKVRPRNDWRPNLKAQGSGGMLADAGSKVDRPVDVRRALRRALPENYAEQTATQMPRQSANARRAEQAAAKATEKIITRVKGVVEKAKK
jgi:hypothetical protein